MRNVLNYLNVSVVNENIIHYIKIKNFKNLIIKNYVFNVILLMLITTKRVIKELI